MAAIVRPSFHEGQILGAADLNAQVDYDRNALLLHERTEHLWGIAQGLTLQEVPRTDAKNQNYVDVNLLPGRAIDRFGRALVVTAPITLDPGDFQLPAPNTTDLFPVFIQAKETPQTTSTQPGKCSTAGPTGVIEDVQISFGPVGSEIAVDQQHSATVDQTLAQATLDDKVLVGFVAFDAGRKVFVKASPVSKSGQGVRYVGVVASEVVAGGGTLGLRTRPDGSRFAVTLAENSTGGCELRFGKQDGDNPVSPTFVVDEKGNVSYTGALNPLPPSKTVAESGVAYHGVCLPLPSGVTQAQVTSGAIRLHVMLTPIPVAPIQQVIPPAAGLKNTIPIVVQCSVDMTTDRRLRCVVRWCDIANPVTTFIDLPSACNYLLIASGQ